MVRYLNSTHSTSDNVTDGICPHKRSLIPIIVVHVLLLIHNPTVEAFLSPLTPRSIPLPIPTTSRPTTTRMALFDPNHLNEASTYVSTMYTGSLPPLDAESTSIISTMKDYFIPTTSNDATIKALEGFVKAKEATSGAALPNSADLIQFDAAMPGTKGLPANPSIQALQTYTYNEKIDKRELEWIAQQFDIYMRKIPFAVTVYALLDFFVLSPGDNRDVLSDELEDDRTSVVMDWASRAVVRIGILASIVFGIIFIENLTFHPL